MNGFSLVVKNAREGKTTKMKKPVRSRIETSIRHTLTIWNCGVINTARYEFLFCRLINVDIYAWITRQFRKAVGLSSNADQNCSYRSFCQLCVPRGLAQPIQMKWSMAFIRSTVKHGYYEFQGTSRFSSL